MIYIPELSLDGSIEEAREKDEAGEPQKKKRKSRLKLWLALLIIAAVLTGLWYAVFTSVLFK